MTKRFYLWNGSLLSVCIVLWSCSAVTAQNTAQLLKAYGHMPGIGLEDVHAVSIDEHDAHEILDGRECGHPDFADKLIADTDAATLSEALDLTVEHCENLRVMHRRMLEAIGSGSFPPRCYPATYPDNHAVTYYVNRDTFPSHFKRPVTDREMQGLVDAAVWDVDTVAEARKKWDRGNLLDTALGLMDESFRRIGCGHIEVATGVNGKHNMHITSEPIRGSVIGFAFFNDGTCDDHVLHVIDSTYQPGLHSLARLLTHEAGHNHNCPHEFRDQDFRRSVMGYRSPRDGLFRGFYPGGPNNVPLPKDASIDRLARYYGGKPVPEIGGGPDTPTSTPGPSPGDGSFTIKVGGDITLLIDGRRVTTVIKRIDGDDGAGTVKRVASALAAIPDYALKDQHRTSLIMIYIATAKAVKDNKSMTLAEAQQALHVLRGLLVGRNVDKWSGVFAIADTVTSANGLLAVVEGLTGNNAIDPLLVRFINVIVTMLPEGKLKTIATLIMSILSGLESEESAEERVRDGALQKASFLDPREASFRHTQFVSALSSFKGNLE